jgi:hypothetical protein
MANKEFKKSFMHPTRRKLADMVQTGEYEKNTQIGFSDIKEEVTRKVGDIWEDSNGYIWEQKEYGRVRQSKSSDTMSDVRNYLQQISTCKASDCDVSGKYSNADKKLISKTGYCAGCLAKREFQIKYDGLWEAYSEYRIYSNMAAHGTDILEKLNNAYKEVSNIHEYVNEDGSVERWKNDKDVEELKAEIQKDIDNGKLELIEVIEKRNAAYELLKDKNYELVSKL